MVDRDIRWKALLFRLPFAICFSLISLLSAWVLYKYLRKPIASDERQHVDAEKSSVIESDGKHQLIGAWLGSICANSLVLPIAVLILSEPNSWWLKTAVFLFALIVIALVGFSIQHTIIYRRYGKATLILHPQQPTIGTRISTTIQYQRCDLAKQRFVVLLVCELVDERGEDITHKMIWNEKQRVTNIGPVIRAHFDIPTGMPESEPETKLYHRWQIRVYPENRKAFKQTFDVIVSAVNLGQP